MAENLADLIEKYLLAAKGWVSADDLCSAFNITRRDLRARGDRPGLCSRFAISGNRGFRHVARCSGVEFDRACRRITSHAEGEFARVRKLRVKRLQALAPPRPVPVVHEQLFLTPP